MTRIGPIRSPCQPHRDETVPRKVQMRRFVFALKSVGLAYAPPECEVTPTRVILAELRLFKAPSGAYGSIPVEVLAGHLFGAERPLGDSQIRFAEGTCPHSASG